MDEKDMQMSPFRRHLNAVMLDILKIQINLSEIIRKVAGNETVKSLSELPIDKQKILLDEIKSRSWIKDSVLGSGKLEKLTFKEKYHVNSLQKIAVSIMGDFLEQMMVDRECEEMIRRFGQMYRVDTESIKADIIITKNEYDIVMEIFQEIRTKQKED